MPKKLSNKELLEIYRNCRIDGYCGECPLQGKDCRRIIYDNVLERLEEAVKREEKTQNNLMNAIVFWNE